jgi:hypothetical protein
METKTDNERVKDHVHEDGASGILDSVSFLLYALRKL